MLLPTDKQCAEAISEIAECCADELTEWERNFVESTVTRFSFSPAQKMIVRQMAEKYDLESYKP